MLKNASIPVIAALLAVLPATAANTATAYQDVLDRPAQMSTLAARGPVTALAQTGPRLVAAGQRGHILYSDDAGQNWKQAEVPVSSDLVALSFPTPDEGWAVGHDGVILHTVDGGQRWEKQFDGRQAGPLLERYYADLAARGALGAPEAAATLLDEVRRVAGQGAENPLLDVWFSDARNGFVIGAFNLIYRTRDGGKSWEPWFHRTANPQRLHLHALQKSGDDLFIVGEQGLLLKLDPVGERFVALEGVYRGSYFGAVAGEGGLIAFGLRGNALKSNDGGKRWQAITTGWQEGVTAAARCRDGRLILASQSGRLLAGDARGDNFKPLKVEQPMPAAALACLADGRLAIGGVRGVRVQQIQ